RAGSASRLSEVLLTLLQHGTISTCPLQPRSRHAPPSAAAARRSPVHWPGARAEAKTNASDRRRRTVETAPGNLEGRLLGTHPGWGNIRVAAKEVRPHSGEAVDSHYPWDRR